MIKVAVAMLGARMHYSVPRLLNEAGFLHLFFTDSYSGNKPLIRSALELIPSCCLPNDLVRWLGRSERSLPTERVVSFEGLGWWYAHARRRAQDRVSTSLVYREAAARFNQKIAQVGLGPVDLVWGFNGAAKELFEFAKAEGRYCVLEQTILPLVLESRLMADEQRRWQGWPLREEDWEAPVAMSGREEAEWALADLIVAGSDFVRDGLLRLGVESRKIRVIPYGVDTQLFRAVGANSDEIESDSSDCLRVLFAGEVGLRKGAPDLFEAFRLVPRGLIEARLAGQVSLDAKKLKSLPEFVRVLGPVPRSLMAELFGWADVLVLPSVCEGSATVTYEALMSGVPVIVTPNTGAPVRDGVDGCVVPTRSPQAIADALHRYAIDRRLLRAHKKAAVDGRDRLGLEVYRENLGRVLREVVSASGTNAG